MPRVRRPHRVFRRGRPGNATACVLFVAVRDEVVLRAPPRREGSDMKLVATHLAAFALGGLAFLAAAAYLWADEHFRIV